MNLLECQFHIMTYLNYTSDQFTGLGGLVIPGTIRDSVYVLEALLEQESGLTPTEIMSDSGSYRANTYIGDARGKIAILLEEAGVDRNQDIKTTNKAYT